MQMAQLSDAHESQGQDKDKAMNEDAGGMVEKNTGTSIFLSNICWILPHSPHI